MEANRNVDDKGENSADEVVAEQKLLSDSVPQQVENGFYDVPHPTAFNSYGTSECEENWDDDVDSSPSDHVVPTWSLFSEEILSAANGRSVFDKLTLNNCEVTSVDLEDAPDCFFRATERSSSKRRRRKYQFLQDMKKVYVKNVSFKTSQRLLWDFFEGFGNVKHCQLIVGKNGRSLGRAVVTFESEDHAKLALAANEDSLSLHGRTLCVSCFRRKVFEPSKATEELDNEKTADTECEKQQLEAPVSDDDSDVRPPIAELSDEMIAYVFMFLSLRERLTAERVCKRWRNVSINFWSSIRHLKIEMSSFCTRACEDRDLKLLLSRGSNALVSLALSCSRLSDRSLHAIAKHCEHLQELSLCRGNFTNNGLKMLAAGCCHLRSFKIHDSFHRIGENGLWWIFHRCKKLQYVDVSGIRKLKGQCLHVLGPDIVKLNLANCSELSDVGIQKVRSTSHKIKELSVAGCCRLTDVSLYVIGQCSTITSLDISGLDVTEKGLKELRHLKHLEILVAAFCSKVNDDFLVAISQGCPKLRYLDINLRGGFMGESNVTDVGIESIVAKCRSLSSLNVSYHQKLSDSSLSSLSQLESIKEVFLSHCEGITDEGVVCLVTRRPMLCSLDLNGCLYVGNLSLLAVLKRMEKCSEPLRVTFTGTSVDPTKIPADVPNLQILFYEYNEDIGNLAVDEENDDFGYEFFPSSADRDYDGYLETDDPLDAERWEMS